MFLTVEQIPSASAGYYGVPDLLEHQKLIVCSSGLIFLQKNVMARFLSGGMKTPNDRKGINA